MASKVAINGFGRIGRLALRAMTERRLPKCCKKIRHQARSDDHHTLLNQRSSDHEVNAAMAGA
jgi:glyceraldehyde-3-phosphate dehydrogenase/erythrose-4-phosphate dehydrogenase